MATSETAAGSVYVFNVFSQALTVSLNGREISGGTIPEWSVNTDKVSVPPNTVAVPRVLNASDAPGKFFNGKNAVTLNWLDGLFAAFVPIDGTTMPLNQDALLLIERNTWQLVNQFGTEIARGDVTPMRLMEEALAAHKKR